MQFRLAHLLFAMAVVAVFFAMRHWWLTTTDDRIAGLMPIVVTVSCGVLLGLSNCTTSVLVKGTLSAGFVSAGAVAIEAFFHSPATGFLYRYPIPTEHRYAAELNGITFLALVIASGMLGCFTGLVARHLIRKTECQWFRIRNNRTTNQRMNESGG